MSDIVSISPAGLAALLKEAKDERARERVRRLRQRARECGRRLREAQERADLYRAAIQEVRLDQTIPPDRCGALVIQLSIKLEQLLHVIRRERCDFQFYQEELLSC